MAQVPDVPPSPRLKNFFAFSGERLSDDERRRVFNGNPLFLRRVAELALGEPTEQRHPSSILLRADRRVGNG